MHTMIKSPQPYLQGSAAAASQPMVCVFGGGRAHPVRGAQPTGCRGSAVGGRGGHLGVACLVTQRLCFDIAVR